MDDQQFLSPLLSDYYDYYPMGIDEEEFQKIQRLETIEEKVLAYALYMAGY